MMMLMLHLMMIEVSPLRMLEMKTHQRKLPNKKKEERERDQPRKRSQRRSRKDKKSSQRSSVSKIISHSLKVT